MIAIMSDEPKKKTVVKSVRLEPGLLDALNAWCESQKPKVKTSAVIEMVITEFLQQRNAWPIAMKTKNPG